MKCPKCGHRYRTRSYREIDMAQLVNSYRAGRSLRYCAQEVGVSYSTARLRLIEAGVTLRPKKGAR
jgi:hypothetical protein